MLPVCALLYIRCLCHCTHIWYRCHCTHGSCCADSFGIPRQTAPLAVVLWCATFPECHHPSHTPAYAVNPKLLQAWLFACWNRPAGNLVTSSLWGLLLARGLATCIWDLQTFARWVAHGLSNQFTTGKKAGGGDITDCCSRAALTPCTLYTCIGPR